MALPLNAPSALQATPQRGGKGGVGAASPTRSCFPWKRRASGGWDSHPYLSCRLHLHRELGRGKESRGWMQSLGMHGAQGGLWRRESGPEAARGAPWQSAALDLPRLHTHRVGETGLRVGVFHLLL